jgi:thiol-disulfide isomerase/thioredoxin
MPPFRRFLPLIAVAVLAVGAAALYRTGPLAGGGAGCRAARDTSARIAPLAKGEVAALAVLADPKPAPAISFNGPDGSPVELSALDGKVRLVNLWATWCVPCRQEMPALDKLQAELGGPDFEVVAVNVDTRNLERPKAWLQENSVTRLAYYADPSGKAMQVLQRSGELVGLPTTLLIDAQGCEIGVLKGPAEWAGADAKALIAAALRRT